MSFRLGLTGSIGMGKSTTSKMLTEMGIPVWDADQVVHALYAKNGTAVALINQVLPGAVVDGAVSRPILRKMIAADPARLDQIQAILRPLINKDRNDFLALAQAPIVVLDVPLLYETGLETLCDAVIVVSVCPEVQEARVMARGQMTKAEFDLILSKQMTDKEKRAKATWVIETTTIAHAKAAVAEIIAEIHRKIDHA
jgi:dephospho-CoA kinase